MSESAIYTPSGRDPDGNPPGGGNPILSRYVKHDFGAGDVLIPILARVNKNSGTIMAILDWDKYASTNSHQTISIEYELVKIEKSNIPIGPDPSTGPLNTLQKVEDGDFYGAVITEFVIK